MPIDLDYFPKCFPRFVFVIDWILTFVFIGGIRVGIRKDGSQPARKQDEKIPDHELKKM